MYFPILHIFNVGIPNTRTPDDSLIFSSIDKPIGAAPGGHFFVGGGGGVWAKKFVMLRGLRISGKKEILRKPTVLLVIVSYVPYNIAILPYHIVILYHIM
jgi:hypothetical protein